MEIDHKKLGKRSRNKGKNGELEIAHKLKDFGFDGAKRTAQRCGRDGTADVVGICGYHIEVKRCEKTQIHDWMDQAKNDASATGDTPVVFHRRSNEKWLATMQLDDLLELLKPKIV